MARAILKELCALADDTRVMAALGLLSGGFMGSAMVTEV